MITFYALFGWPKDNYKEAASDNLVVPSVTTTSDTDDTEEESEEAPEEGDADEESDTEE